MEITRAQETDPATGAAGASQSERERERERRERGRERERERERDRGVERWRHQRRAAEGENSAGALL